MRHGKEQFNKTMIAISCMEPYINMPFGQSWDEACAKALWYLDGKADTPLWFWR